MGKVPMMDFGFALGAGVAGACAAAMAKDKDCASVDRHRREMEAIKRVVEGPGFEVLAQR